MINYIIKNTKKTVATKYRLKRSIQKKVTLLKVLTENFHRLLATNYTFYFLFFANNSKNLLNTR